jgi:hypothetical protein
MSNSETAAARAKFKPSVIRAAIEKVVIENAVITTTVKGKAEDGTVLEFVLTNKMLDELSYYVK